MNDIAFHIQPTAFMSRRTLCRGDLYLPDDIPAPPVVIMAHGFGAERTFGLPAYAERFAQQGMAVLLFDYRSFGSSDGEPRNYVDPSRHLADWRSAIAHVRSMDILDSNRIALWGSSFSGGHVIVTAARDRGVRAIIAQVPFVDPFSTIRKLGLGYLLSATPHAFKDIFRLATFRSPHCVKIIGQPDEFAVMNTPESYPGYKAMVPPDTDWQNRCPARILLSFSLYRPLSAARKIECPALIMAAKQDSLIDVNAVEKTAERIKHATLIKYPFGHFDIYTGQFFENAVKTQAEFLVKHLSGK